VAEVYDYAESNENRVAVFSNQPSAVNVKATNNARLRVWSLQGTLLKEVMISEGNNVVDGLITNGVCLFEFIFENGEKEIKQVIVK
jgi:hypothetical protein